MDCVGCVDHCSKDTGCMSECSSRYYRKYNDNLNGFECVPCQESCTSCNNVNGCTACETGKWGNACQYNCSGCNASCDIHYGCSSVCLSGYYGIVINGGIHCEICPDNCVSCRDNKTCEKCRSGFYLPDETNCIVCPDKCLGNDCITNKGICTKGCTNGWTGHQCNQKCPAGCLLCEQFNSSDCISCKTGFYGNSCENICSVHCKQLNGQSICNRFNGSCIKGCETGYWGQNCSRPCGLGCYENQCNETTGICLSGCKQNFSGNLCNQECTDIKDIVCSDQHKSVITDENNTENTVVVLSVVAGLAIVVAAISITGNLILFKRRCVCKKETGSLSATEDHEMDTNTYQDLTRTESTDAAYSSVIHDYEFTS